jgi:hypothetical protein
MQLVENPIKGPFETQHDGRKDSQIVARGVLLGNYAFQLLAEKFQGDRSSLMPRNMRVTSRSRQPRGFQGFDHKSLRTRFYARRCGRGSLAVR